MTPLSKLPPREPTIERVGELSAPPVRLRSQLVQVESPIPPPVRTVAPFVTEPGCEGERVIDLPVAPSIYPDDSILLDHGSRGTRQTSLESILDYATPVIVPTVERLTLSFVLTQSGWMARFPAVNPVMVQVVFSDGAADGPQESVVEAPIRRAKGECFVFISSNLELPPFVYADLIR